MLSGCEITVYAIQERRFCMGISENTPNILNDAQKQNNAVNGSGKSNGACEHRYCVLTGKFVNEKNQVYYNYKCTECGYEYSTHSSGGTTGSW